MEDMADCQYRTAKTIKYLVVLVGNENTERYKNNLTDYFSGVVCISNKYFRIPRGRTIPTTTKNNRGKNSEYVS